MPQTSIVIKPLLPLTRILAAEKYQRALEKALEEEAGIQERMYMRVGRGFSDPPEFEQELKKGKLGSLSITVSTKSEPFVYIDQGTDIRWAVMSNDFRARTTPRTLGIKGKQGSAIIRGKSAMLSRGIQARPGIEARNYSDEIAKRRKKPFAVKVQKAIKRAAR